VAPVADVVAAGGVVVLSGADYLSVFSKPQLDALAFTFLKLRHSGLDVVGLFWGLWLVPLGVLVMKSRFIPRLLGVLVIAAGVAYIVGRRGNDTTDGWKTGNHIFIFDLGNPASPVYLRDWALDGQQPGGVTPPNFTAVPSIHGPISTGPAGGAIGLTGATADRVYFAYGTGSNGVMQVSDRSKLLGNSYSSGA